MNDCNFGETLTNTHSNLNLSDQTKFRLNEINKIEDYVSSEIQKKNKKAMSKKVSKYIAAFDILAGTARASFTLIFYLATGII